MNILYSFNKKGREAEYWTHEISLASDHEYKFIPFNHGELLDPKLYVRAQILDDLYFNRDKQLMHLYNEFESALNKYKIDAVVVDNRFPYHPDYLRKIKAYKVLRTTDGPVAAYDRDLAFLHAYDHVLYHSPAYSPDMGMEEKLRYCGARRVDFWPLAVFDALYDKGRSETSLFSQKRDIDLIFIGAQHLNKMPLLADVKRAFGRRFYLYGVTTLKRNIYFNIKFRLPGWIRSVPFTKYVSLYQRTKIGINVHNRGKYTVGNYRLFDLAANGVMQISDGGEYLQSFYDVGSEIVSYDSSRELINKISYYLSHEDERLNIAINSYRRVMRDHRLKTRMRDLGKLISKGINNF
ncbi:MAG: glycosyltransferase [Gammaproteobacteria bacterium]|nr:glycosyltransferase [Gammaproteobacteria bacterium]